MNCYCDYEEPIFYFRKTPVAQKRHICDECDSDILLGEIYEKVTAKWNQLDKIITFKTCMDCVAVRSALMDMDCFCWSHGGLWMDIRTQFIEADFPGGMRFSCLRLVANHRGRRRQRRQDRGLARFKKTSGIV